MATSVLARHPSLKSLRAAASHCRACPLYRRATQTVFGQGRRNARIMLVGEQPAMRKTWRACLLSGLPGAS
jgi:uracil-DNA glycosylase